MYQETREMVTVNHWTDRIYQNTQQEHVVSNVVSGRKMKMIKYNMPDTGKRLFITPKIQLNNVNFSCVEPMGCNIGHNERFRRRRISEHDMC